MRKFLSLLQSVPGKVIFWIIVGVTMVGVVLHFAALSAAVKAKDLNLSALISDALTKLKLQQNKDKIKDLDKPVKKEDLESDPKKVEDFYMNRK